MPRFSYTRYAKDIVKYTEEIDASVATSTSRFGLSRIRDMFISMMRWHSEGGYYVGLIKDFLYLLALIPLALKTIGLSDTYTFMFISVYIMLSLTIGFISYRVLNLPRREKEIDDLMSMSRFLTWDKLKNIETQLEELKALTRTKRKKAVKKKKM